MLQNNSTIKSLIDKLWNNFWSGGISNPLTAIEQITYLVSIRKRITAYNSTIYC
jgi:type I restriction enzyme M protein